MGFRGCIAVIFVCAVLVSGCQGGEIDPRPGSGSISVTYNEFAVSDDGATINGTVDLELYVEEMVEFEDVMACAYDGAGHVIQTDKIGTLASPTDSGRLEFDTDVRPEYIVVDHPKLAEFEGVGLMVLRWDESLQHYERGDTADLSFGYQPPDSPGECGTAT